MKKLLKEYILWATGEEVANPLAVFFAFLIVPFLFPFMFLGNLAKLPFKLFAQWLNKK